MLLKNGEIQADQGGRVGLVGGEKVWDLCKSPLDDGKEVMTAPIQWSRQKDFFLFLAPLSI